MRFVYFTKTLPGLQVGDWVKWCQAYGLDGLDLAVRPGYPVNPDNMLEALPVWSETLAKAKLGIGVVTAPTNLNDPTRKEAELFFKACKVAGVSSIKIGYFPFEQDYPRTYQKARLALEGFASLARDTGVKALLHTHSGLYLGNNAAGQRLLLEGLDPHEFGSFLDSGHLALGGGPFQLELQLVKPWFSCLAIKDIEWAKGSSGWKNKVVPAGLGIVRWDEVGRSLKELGFDGTISLHGEYSMEGSDNRGKAAAAEKAFLVKKLAN